MDLAEIKKSRKIHNAVWTYDLCAKVDKTQWPQMTSALEKLIDKLEREAPNMQEQKLLELFDETTKELEKIFQSEPLDEGGIYEYGGLNYFYADLAEALGFAAEQGEYALKSDFVYHQNFE